MAERVLLAWSGGKDSALSLHEIRRGGDYEVAALLTTVTEDTGRVGMHAVARELVATQAAALGLPLREIAMPAFPENRIYEDRLSRVLQEYAAQGIRSVAFGDLFLADIRAYREQLLARLDLQGLYPIWQRDTAELAREFVALGFRAVLVCVDLRVLDRSFAGRAFDEHLLADLPPGVDPCGENGEFHTFVFDGPGFRHPVGVEPADVRDESTFAYCDLRAI